MIRSWLCLVLRLSQRLVSSSIIRQQDNKIQTGRTANSASTIDLVSNTWICPFLVQTLGMGKARNTPADPVLEPSVLEEHLVILDLGTLVDSQGRYISISVGLLWQRLP